MPTARVLQGRETTRQHIRTLSRHAKNRIIYLFDGDEAGQRAADRALQFIDSSITPEAGRTRIDLCAVTLPDNLDPADFVEKRGAQALLYGHTHIPHIDYHDGLWLVNPGSIGDHRRPSYGVLTVEGDKLSPANFTLE